MLHAGDDPVHDRHRLDRIVAGCALGREHDRVGAVIDRGRHVRGLGPGGRGRADHALQHLGRHHHRLAEVAALADDPLLQARHQLRRQLDAEIAPRDHDRVRELDDPVQPLDRGRLLDLGQDRRPAADQAPRLGDVLGALHEGQRHPVEAQLDPEAEVGMVLLWSWPRSAGPRSGTFTPLRSDSPPPFTTVVSAKSGPQRSTRSRMRPSSSSRSWPGCRTAKISGCGRLARLLVALRLVEVEPEVVAARQGDPAVGEAADPELGPLQIHDRADRPAAVLLDLANDREARRVVLVAAVAEVEAEHVGAGIGQLADPLLGRAGRTQRRDDLGAAVSAHASHSLDAARPIACRRAGLSRICWAHRWQLRHARAISGLPIASVRLSTGTFAC